MFFSWIKSDINKISKTGYLFNIRFYLYFALKMKNQVSMGEYFMEQTKQYELNKNLAQMLKGGVIMDVTTPEQAKIAEAAGACAVMALERIPADIRAAGGGAA